MDVGSEARGESTQPERAGAEFLNENAEMYLQRQNSSHQAIVVSTER